MSPPFKFQTNILFNSGFPITFAFPKNKNTGFFGGED